LNNLEELSEEVGGCLVKFHPSESQFALQEDLDRLLARLENLNSRLERCEGFLNIEVKDAIPTEVRLEVRC